MDLDFKGLGAQAVEMFNSAQTGTPEPSTPAPVVPASSGEPVVATPAATPAIPSTPALATPVTPGQPPVAASPAAEKLIEVDFGNGRVEKLTESQVKDAYHNGLRQQDYTRKTQELSRQRAEVEAVYAQLQQQAMEFQRQQQMLQQQGIQPHQQQPEPQIDPNQPMTIGQAMQMAQALAERVQQAEQGMGQRSHQLEQQAQQYVESRLAVANYAEAINGTIGQIFTEQPVLKALPEFEDMLRFRVAQLQPQTLEDAQKAFRTVAAEVAGNIGDVFKTLNQQQVVQRQALTTQGIEPPGTAVPAPPQTSYRTEDGKMDWNKLRGAALDLVNQR